MPAERLSVVVTRRLPEVVETRLSELFNVELSVADEKMSREDLIRAMQRADVLVPTVTDRIDQGMLAAAGDRLKLIANYGAGVDHIDVHTARQRGILVSNTPGVLTEDTADMAMALIMAVVRRIPEGLALMQQGGWEGWAPTAMLGGRLAGRRIGILGMGRLEGLDLFRARRQSDEIVGRPPDESAGIGRWIEGEAFSLQASLDVGIDRIVSGRGERLVGPPTPIRLRGLADD